jgi:hypothetical protein
MHSRSEMFSSVDDVSLTYWKVTSLQTTTSVSPHIQVALQLYERVCLVIVNFFAECGMLVN